VYKRQPDELNQVWTALLHNALQAMEGGTEKRLTIHLAQKDEANGMWAVVRFTDTGCGIAPEIREKIFDAFFTTQAGGQGNGMGLTTVKKIIDKHHGKIEVDSEVGRGTTITVVLPYLAQ
jgi:two-component system NtrC family sensor kinase